MSLSRRTASMDPFRRAMNGVFEAMEQDMMAPWGVASRFPSAELLNAGLRDERFNMNVDFHETDNGFEMTADLPGMSKKDITVDVDNDTGVLTVSGERKNSREERSDDADGTRRYHFVERSYGKTTRSIRLPETADTAKAKADYSDGVLTLTFPRREMATPRRLTIPVGDVGQADSTVTIK